MWKADRKRGTCGEYRMTAELLTETVQTGSQSNVIFKMLERKNANYIK